MRETAIDGVSSTSASLASTPIKDRKQLPCFETWQARQLWGRDLVYAVFSLSTWLMYLYKAGPAICSIGPECYEASTPLLGPQHTTCDANWASSAAAAVNGSSMQHWPLNWQLACGYLTDSSSVEGARAGLIVLPSFFKPLVQAAIGCASHVNGSIETKSLGGLAAMVLLKCGAAQAALVAASKVTRAVLYVGQGFTLFFGLGWLHSDLLHIAMTPLLIVLQAVLLLPASWRRPRLRQALVVLCRLVHPTAAAISAGSISTRFLQQTCLSFFPSYVTYMFTGWGAWMLVLPSAFNVAVTLVEWLVVSYASWTATKVHQTITPSITYYLPLHLLFSFTVIVLVPGFAVTCLHHNHRQRFAQAVERFKQKQQKVQSSKSKKQQSGTAAQQNGVGATAATSSSSSNNGKRRTASSSTGSSSGQLLAGQMTSLKPASQTKSNAAIAVAAVSNGVIPDVMPSLRTLIGQQDAASVYAAAAAAAQSGTCQPGRMLHYKSMASALPLTVKVHNAPHDAVPTVGPLLSGALEQWLTAPWDDTSSSRLVTPAYLHSVCFPGCVQLLAIVYSKKEHEPAADDSNDTGCSGSDSRSSSSTAARTAVKLLDNVCSSLRVAGTLDNSISTAPVVDVLVGAAVASTHGNRIALPLGLQVEATNGSSGSGAGSDAAKLQASLLHCEPCCLVAGRQRQQLTLHLCTDGSNSRGSGNQSSQCRLLVFQRGVLLADKEVLLDRLEQEQAVTVRALLPTLSSGVAHVALLTGGKPAAAAAGSQHPHRSSSSDGIAAAAAAGVKPLLLQPLLVVPEAVAPELHALWLSAAQVHDGNNNSSSKPDTVIGLAAAANAWQAVSSLTVDAAYVLSFVHDTTKIMAADTAAAAGSNSCMPPAVVTVFKHLSRHLAACQCWETLRFLLQQMAAPAAEPTAAAAAAPTGCIQSPFNGNASSNSNCGSLDGSQGSSIEFEPDSKPSKQHSIGSSSSGCGSRSTGSDVKCNGISIKADTDSVHLDVHAAAQQEAAATGEQSGPSVLTAVRWLCTGFRCPIVEESYINSVAAQAVLGDAIFTVHQFLVMLSAKAFTEALSRMRTEGMHGLLLWELFTGLFTSAVFILPNIAIVLHRRRLAVCGRRETAVLWADLAMAMIPLCTALGLLRTNPSAVEMLKDPGLKVTIMFWVSGVFKAGCRQVCARTLLPSMLVEFLAATWLSVQLGLTLGLSVVRYFGITVVGMATAAVQELRGRQAYLAGVQRAAAAAAANVSSVAARQGIRKQYEPGKVKAA